MFHDRYSGFGATKRGDLENICTSLEVELFAGCFRIVSEGVTENDIPNKFIYISSPMTKFNRQNYGSIHM